MPGFGDNPFGGEPFGKWPWSKQVLFDSLPGLYRDQDAQNGGYLESWCESLRYSYDALADKIYRWNELRDVLKVRSQYSDTTLLRLGTIQLATAPIEQRGADGAVDGLRRFIAGTARFRAEDVGKNLTLLDSAIAINNRTFKIASVINVTTVTCEPPLVTDAGPIRWELRDESPIPDGVMIVETRGGDVSRIAPGWVLSDGSSQFTVYARQQFFPTPGQTKSLTLRGGTLGQGTAAGNFLAEAEFSLSDVGKPITISGSDNDVNNGKFEIYAIDLSNPAQVRLHDPILIAGATLSGSIYYVYQVGNSGVYVRHVAEGASQLLTVSVYSKEITVSLATNASGVVTSTASDVATAVNANTDAAALVAAVPVGGGVAAITDGFQLIPGTCLAPDAGPLTWALLPFPQLQILAAAPPAGVIEQEGVDLATSGGGVVSSTTAKFTSADVGKIMGIRGSLVGSDGLAYAITAVNNINEAVLLPAPAAGQTGLLWEVRTLTDLEDRTKVQVSAPSMLEYLARDFGVTIDYRESDARQRTWVESVPKWIDIKGVEKAYEIIGAISGFSVTASALYRITNELAPGVSTVVYDAETAVGRAGTDGALTLSGGVIRFSAASAVFKRADEGVSLRIGNAADGGNNKVYTIDSFVNATTVDFLLSDTATLPEYGSGGSAPAPTLDWELVRIYTPNAPTRPLFDEVDVELMQSIVGQANFSIDAYCSDPVFVNYVGVTIDSVAPPASIGSLLIFTVTATGLTLPGPIYTSCGVVLRTGRWNMTDSAGNTYYLESVPIQTVAGPPPTHTFQVYASTVPALGAATLTYVCDSLESCDYCKSNKILVEIEEDTILYETGLARERAFDRVLQRLETEVRPQHVKFITVFVQRLKPIAIESASAFGTPTVT